jgi:LysR family transcriptional regulator, flagellar master operon regulator
VAASLAPLGSADATFTLGYCSSRTCRCPTGSHRSRGSGNCRHRDNVCPQHRPGLKIDLVLEEELVLVTTDPKADSLDASQYVLVEWGAGIFTSSRSSFSRNDAFSSDKPWSLGSQLCPLEGGAGYFRMHAVKPHLISGELHVVPGAPKFSFPIYAVHSANVDEVTLTSALKALREVSTAEVRNEEA